MSTESESLLGTIGRGALAVAVGYVLLGMATLVLNYAAAVIMGVPLSTAMAEPSARPSAVYSAVNLLLSLPAAALGGYATASIARRARVVHAIVLGILVLVLGAGYQLVQLVGRAEGSVTEPVWYLLLLPALGFVGALGGGFLRARREPAEVGQGLSATTR